MMNRIEYTGENMAEPMRDPKNLQAQIEEFQRTQRQLSLIASQHQQMLMQLEELKLAQEYLKDTKAESAIFKAVGNLLVQTEKKSANKEIDERLEVFDVRERSLKKQEDTVRERLDKMRKELEKAASS